MAGEVGAAAGCEAGGRGGWGGAAGRGGVADAAGAFGAGAGMGAGGLTAGAAGLVSCAGGGAGRGGGAAAGVEACCFARIAFSTSPGFEMCERSIFGLMLSPSGLDALADLAAWPSPEPWKWARTFSAS